MAENGVNEHGEVGTWRPKAKYELFWAGCTRTFVLSSNVEFMKQLNTALNDYTKTERVSHGLIAFIKQLEGMLSPSDDYHPVNV